MPLIQGPYTYAEVISSRLIYSYIRIYSNQLQKHLIGGLPIFSFKSNLVPGHTQTNNSKHLFIHITVSLPEYK
jgi:hypothetical protein